MSPHEFDQALGVDVGAEFAGIGAATLFRGIDIRVVIALVAWRVAGLKTGPHRPVIEPVLL